MKLLNINKYFNKGKSNELHVLNNISLDLPNTGLVAIMGQSGSGKTTLLNVLCGLDKINSGEIEVNGTQIKKYKNKTWDRLRNQEFGYIFQNYNIFEDKTVFDNVALSLEFLGMKDKAEIKERVMQALTLVGMDKYRNRQAGALSGGEMQRVAIARALVKNPGIMIADEPTGNLDEKNTIMIMNILKKISKNRLVILVTHEKEIGEFYADTIVHIQDGKIQDVTSGSNNELKLYSDNTIYLQDLDNSKISENSMNITTYYSEKFDANIKIDIILKGDDILISATSSDKRIKYVDNNSYVNIVDGKKPQLTKEEIDKNVSNVTEIMPLDKSKLSGKYNIGLFSHIKKGFQRVFDLSKFKKAFLLGFVISACLMVLSVSAYVGVSAVNENDFLKYDRNQIVIEYKDTLNITDKYQVISNLLSEGKIKDIYPVTDYFSFYTPFATPSIKQFSFIQTARYSSANISGGTYIPYTEVDDYKGVKPNPGEVIIDKFIAEELYSVSISNGNTIQNEDVLLISSMVVGDRSYKIVGVADNNNACIYINPANKYDFVYTKYLEYSGQIPAIPTLNKGEMVVKTNEAESGVAVGATVAIDDINYTVKGIINDTETTSSTYYFNSEDIKYMMFKDSLEMSRTIYVTSSLKVKDLKKEFDKSTVKSVERRYDVDYKNARNDNMYIARILLVFALITVIAPLIFLFFLMRSSMISRVKETGIYRALGLSKGSIIKMHASEALAISASGSLIGWIFGVVLIFRIRSVVTMFELFSANPLVLIASLVACILINLIVGCLPIIFLLRRTPQQILSKYDI